MPFETDTSGAIVMQELNGQKMPVFVHADGRKAPFDADSTIATISRLNGEAKTQREAKEALELAFKPFKDAGLSDAQAARKAMDIVKGLDEKKLVDAGSRDQAIAEAVKSVRLEFEPVLKERDTFKTELYNEKIGGAFARSKFIADRVVIPADMVQAAFGHRFSIENGKTIAKDANGQPIFSRTRHGEPADFEEALEIMVDGYAHKASILKGSGASGGGSTGNGGQGAGGKKSYSRQQFESLDMAGKRAAATEVSKGTAVIAD